MHDPLRDAQRLIHQNHLNDGLPEILIGVLSISYGGVSWIESIPHKSLSLRVLGLLLILVLAALGLGSMRLIQWTRTRFFLERSGFVEYKQVSARLRLVLLSAASAALAVAIAWMLVHRVEPGRWLVAGIGLTFGAAQVALVRTLRSTLFGILSIVAGGVLALTPLPIEIGLAIFFCSVGLVMMISGLVVFMYFLRQPGEGLPE